MGNPVSSPSNAVFIPCLHAVCQADGHGTINEPSELDRRQPGPLPTTFEFKLRTTWNLDVVVSCNSCQDGFSYVSSSNYSP